MASLTIEGDAARGYWVNLGPGALRLSDVFATHAEAARRLNYYRRTCGVNLRLS